MRRSMLTLLTIAMFACSRSAPAPTTTTGAAAQPAASSGPRVVFPDGTAIHVEIANDDPTREQGLMYRDRLAEDHGMIFIFPSNGAYPFWMKNTLIPLDMIWIDENRKVVNIASNVPPCKADPCPSFGSTTILARYVLETAAGVARKHGLVNGNVLRFEGLDNVVVR